MSAFNWILITDECPSCKLKVIIRCQTHVASSFNNHFHDHEYALGEKMKWYNESDQEYFSWRIEGRKNSKFDTHSAEEACYSKCTNCGVELFVILCFQDLIPKAILGIGLANEWPPEYWK